MGDLNNVQEFLMKENRKILASLPADHMTRKALIQIVIRVMDIFYSQQYKSDDDKQSVFYELGYTKALNFLINESVDELGWVGNPVDDFLWQWGNSFLYHCGKVALLERLEIYVKAGIANFENHPDLKTYEFTYVSGEVDLEGMDRDAAQWYKKSLYEGFSKPNLDALKDGFKVIEDKLKSIVQPWGTHLIQYQYDDTSIDDYYQKLAYYRSASMLNQDLFPPETTFGGIPYSVFVDFAELNMAVSMKHKDFCAALIGKNNTIKIPDIISLFMSRTETIKTASLFLKQPESIVSQLMDSVTMDNENKLYHVDREVSPAAPFIKIGTDSLIRSSFGCEGNPYYFLNNELKRAYPNDYFKGVNERENFFREQLYTIFDPAKYVAAPQSIVIKIDNIHTDIDAALFNTSTGTLALFQLKWQDPFGKSMRQRNSRIKNFYPKTIEWIDKITEWVRDHNNRMLMSSLGFDPTSTINSLRIFVINRNAAHFTGLAPDQRVAWCSWYQFLNASSKITGHLDELESIYLLLTEKQTENSPQHQREKLTFSMEDHTIILQDYSFD